MSMLNRPRRMRESSFSRTLMRENNISVSNLIYPMFVIEGNGIRQDIESMPGIQRLSIDELIKDASECHQLGIPAIAIFPYIDKKLKTNDASEAFNDNGLVQRTIQKLKKDQFLNLIICAFQRRFRQELINGKIDHECLIISQNLVKKFN